MSRIDPKAVETEADEIVEELGLTRNADDLEHLAASLLRGLASYNKGAELGRAVAAELRRRAAALRVN